MAFLNHPDVILYVALFLDSDTSSDEAHLSLVNHFFYETLLSRRARHLRVYPSSLPSLALFLIRNKAFRHCQSLKVLVHALYPSFQTS